MKNIKKLLSTDLNESQVDDKMSKILEEKFNNELRDKYAQKLKQEHNITRDTAAKTTSEESTSTIESDDKSSVTKFLLPLLLIAVMLGGYFLLKNKSGTSTPPANTQEQVQQFFASNEVEFIDNNRSGNQTNESRAAAINNFQNKEYRRAGENFTQIDRSIKTTQDKYYQAYSQLRAGQTMDAAIGFGNVVAATKKGDNYHHEAKLYQILSIIELKDFNKAKNLYNQLEVGSWEQKKLQDIIEGIK